MTMSQASRTPLLDTIQVPADLRRLPKTALKQVADELRLETIDAVSVTGGHLGAGLGVVELTVALHYVFDTPHDRIVWDVGHQAYPHKILTGRRDRIRTLRQGGGLSGFTKRAESEYDPFGAAHSSTSISAGLGMAVARDLGGEKRNVVAVIGDGAMSAGMAYEAMNNAGARSERLIVILNDNDMSIARPVGALSNYLARITSSGTYLHLRDAVKQLAKRLPKYWERRAALAEEYTRTYWTGGTLFEEMGFYYVGPIDGHDLRLLLSVLRNVRDAKSGPILIHVVTRKGKGYPPAEASDDKYHGVNKFNVVTGAQVKAKSNAPSYTKVFGQSLIEAARKDDKIVAITAAMPSGTGLDLFAEEFPERTFDVGIAEQHARDVRRRAGGGGLQAVRGDLLHLPAARLRPGGARRGDPAPARALRHRPRRAGGGRRPDARRRLRRGLPRLPAGLRADGGRRRGRAQAHGGHRRGHRRPPVGAALPARRRRRRGAAGGGRAVGDRQGPGRARGYDGGAAVLRRPPRRVPQGRRPARRLRVVDHGRGCPLRQAARYRPGGAARPQPRGADHRGGGLRLAASAARCCNSWPPRASSTAASRCGPWCCRTGSSTTTSPS